MSAFYLHIPFCRQACRYCDFHFAVSLSYRDEMFQAMIREIKMRKSEFAGEKFSSIYFGGGTPSILMDSELATLMDAIFENYSFEVSPEVTFEANPDDISNKYVLQLQKRGINRLSLGVQSFRDNDLQIMRRSHNAGQALKAIRTAQDLGLTNINIDLMYGVPGLDLQAWITNLEQAFGSHVQHISAYHLTYEPGTVFDHWQKKGRLVPISEEAGVSQFGVLQSMSSAHGFIHYEISNFAREGFYSKHNTSYWKQVPYIGIGPSAHSFYGNTRKWNVSNNKRYISMIMNGDLQYSEQETLTPRDQFNEYLLTSLRTMWGIDLQTIHQRYGLNYVKYTEKIAGIFLQSGEMIKKGPNLSLTKKGIFVADFVVREFFLVKGQDEF